jgi:hypothetical protein
MYKFFISLSIASFSLASVLSCQSKQTDKKNDEFPKGTFGYDAKFLTKYQETIVLKNGDAMLAVCPGYQGRVMTSTSGGESGMSYGWINHKLIESGEIPAHILPVGGEDRFWLGPEGGQFSIYFAPGEEFIFENWQTPAPIDTQPFELVSSDERSTIFEKQFELTNYSNHQFSLKVRRKVGLVPSMELEELIQIPEQISYVAYQSKNTISNIGDQPWTKDSGALSIWILGMFKPSERTTILVPYKEGSVEELGPVVTDTYFGKVPGDRLKVRNGLIYFRGDGKYRSKIGLGPARAMPLMGSYDEENKVLTIVFYSKPGGASEYVNALWKLQDDPFAGDVANSYNDGPVNGEAMGPFYELESSSPAAFLAVGESMTHIHTTIHMQGAEAELNKIIQELFKIEIETIKSIF